VAQHRIANGEATADQLAGCWEISEAVLISAMGRCGGKVRPSRRRRDRIGARPAGLIGFAPLDRRGGGVLVGGLTVGNGGKRTFGSIDPRIGMRQSGPLSASRPSAQTDRGRVKTPLSPENGRA